DGSMLIAPATGKSLVTSQGVWTFGTATAPGGNRILLNGAPAANEYGHELLVDEGGKMFKLTLLARWYEWTGTSWLGLSGPPPTVITIQPAIKYQTIVGLGGNAINAANSLQALDELGPSLKPKLVRTPVVLNLSPSSTVTGYLQQIQASASMTSSWTMAHDI